LLRRVWPRVSFLLVELILRGVKYGILGLIKDSIFVEKVSVRLEENLNEVIVHKDFKLSDPMNGDL
jgi:hypothetical protein